MISDHFKFGNLSVIYNVPEIHIFLIQIFIYIFIIKFFNLPVNYQSKIESRIYFNVCIKLNVLFYIPLTIFLPR